jgi:hypothetical protein
VIRSLGSDCRVTIPSCGGKHDLQANWKLTGRNSFLGVLNPSSAERMIWQIQTGSCNLLKALKSKASSQLRKTSWGGRDAWRSLERSMIIALAVIMSLAIDWQPAPFFLHISQLIFTWDWSISVLILHMKFQSMRLNSAHEINHLPWFFTWDWSISVLILHMKFQSMRLNSAHEINQLPWFFTWDWSISILILHMRLINFCLDSSHEINQSASILHMRLIIFLDSSHKIDQSVWFFTWDQSISVLILQMRSINFCLDSSHEIDQSASICHTRLIIICLDSSHEINQCVLILHMRLINFCLDSSHEINGSICINSSHEINGSICLNSSHEIDWSIHLASSLTVYCASLNTHPFREPASTLLRMTHIAHLEYNIMSFQIVTLNFSHCELHPTHPPKFQAHSQFYIRLAISALL